jgi:DNA-binding transcriptional LysR family regulator
MNDRLLALKLFVRLARTGSFSQAGKDLKLSQPSASRLTAAFEREVGTKLFVRSTRAVTLTEAGADYLARIEPALAEIEEAGQALRGKGALRGNLRIGVPASAAIREVIPRLPAFLAKHPELRIDLAVGDGRQDLIREGIDVAIRFGKLEDSSATAIRIGTNPLLVAASPAYLKRAGMPATPNDLPKFSMMVGLPGTDNACSFEKNGRVVSVKADAPLSANIREAAVAGAVAGIGIVACSLWACRAELKSKALVQILTDWDMGAAEVHAVYPAGRGVKTATRSFVDFFQKDLKTRP